MITCFIPSIEANHHNLDIESQWESCELKRLIKIEMDVCIFVFLIPYEEEFTVANADGFRYEGVVRKQLKVSGRYLRN